jgi:hypothetical protein
VPDREPKDSIAYQPLLRVLGAYLDDQGCAAMELLEEPTGFSLLHGRERCSPVTRLARFQFDELWQTERDRKERRSHDRDAQDTAALTDSYEDFLRALGYELEQAGAYSVLVAEIEDDFLVTYQYLNAAEGFVVRKRMSVIGAEERREIVQAARERWAQPERPRRGLLELFGRS